MGIVGLIFLLLVVYQIKHLAADYFLQGEYMLGKFKPGWDFLKPLFAHVGVHAGITFFIAVGAFTHFDPGMTAYAVFINAIGIAVFDAFVHFFMDRIKASPKLMGRWKPVTAQEFMQCKQVERDYGGTLYPDSWLDSDERVVLAETRSKLRGNKLFWWCLGLDQAVHHLTHYVCIYFILKAAGVL